MTASIPRILAVFLLLGLCAILLAAQGTDSATKIYVLSLLSDKVLVFGANLDGDLRPLGAIAGRETGLNDPVSAAFDAQGNLYVLNRGFSGSITVFGPEAMGNVRPLRAISGFGTGLGKGAECLAVDGSGNIYVSESLARAGNGPDSATVYEDSLLVFPPGADGDVKPIRTIKGSATRMYYVHGVALDKEGNLYVASAGDRINGHETGMRVTVYAPGANGDAAPIRTIEGPDTGLHSPFFLALDGSGNLYVANQARFEGKVTTVVYARGASGDARPVRTLQGPPMHDAGDMGDAVAVDGTGSLYMNDHDGGAALVYAPGAGGNTPPIRTIKGGNTQLRHPRFLAVWPTGPSAPGATAETSPPSPARPARVTAVHLRVEPQSYSGPCPRAIQLVGDITTDGPGEAYYQFQAGAVGANREGALHFDAAGTQSVTSDGQIRRTLLVPSVRFLAGLEPRGHQENAKWADATLDLKCESAK